MPTDTDDPTTTDRRGALGAIATAAASLLTPWVPDSLPMIGSGLLGPTTDPVIEHYTHRDGYSIGATYLISDGMRVFPRFGPEEWREYAGVEHMLGDDLVSPWEAYYQAVMRINDTIAAGQRKIVGLTDDDRPVFWTGEGDPPDFLGSG